jgi:hypothetical protein
MFYELGRRQGLMVSFIYNKKLCALCAKDVHYVHIKKILIHNYDWNDWYNGKNL